MSKHTRTTSKAAGLVLAALSLVVSLLPALPAQAATTFAKISFGVADIAPPTGYTVDSGQAYTTARGFGWIDESDNNPEDLTGNTRYSWTKTAGYITVLQMQQKATTGVITTGRWEYAIANGTYDVTVTAGDARSNDGINLCCNDATNRLTAEGVLVVNDFRGTTAQPLTTQTVTVAVSDGKLTLDAVGGVNTKLDRVVIASASGPAQPVTPVITSVTPAASATQVGLNTAVSLGLSQSVDLAKVNATNFTLTGPNGVVPGNYNADAAGGTASFTPAANLLVNTVYTVNVTSGFTTPSGTPFAPFSSTFTTGTAPPPLASTAFTERASVPVPKPNVLTIGPDDKLYVGTAGGKLFRFTRGSDGTLTNGESITPFGSRVITGLAFDPAHPTTLWVTNNYSGYTNAPRMSGHLSTIVIQPGQPLSADVASATDVVVGFPRSEHDHMTNGIAFGPDGKLYIAQGANTAYGAPDAYWGTRGEAPMTASILVADVENASAFPAGSTLDVNTDVVGTTEDTGSDPAAGYVPTAANAPVKVYASGIRNPFTLMWDSNGSLYAPVNESASGGNTPSPESNNPPPAMNVQAYTDYFTRVVAGKYYGHPNPAQGYFTLNGGNPTAQGDPYEVTEYPVGVLPDPNWRAPDFAMGVHRSPDGAAEYTNGTAFGGALQGKILVSEYSNGDDLVAVNLDGTGKPISEAVLPDAANPGQALIFNNPLGVATDAAHGFVYVAEAQSEADPSAGVVTLLSPGADTTVNNGIHVNFQPASVTAPTGYSADTGAAFNGQSGWQDLSGAPLDMTANTRVRHSASSPDVRYDTQLIMQASSGNTTPGRWATTLPNGQYDVSVTVGDPTAINSVHEITAQPGTADSTVIIDHFTPTTGNFWSTQTKRVNVSNGLLVLSPAGGTQTKIDFVDAVPAGVDNLAPSVNLALSGPQSGDSSSPYVGPVTVTATATDNVGVTSTTYVLDGAAAVPYTTPVVVSSVGSHTITVTAKDAATNSGNATSTFTISSNAPTSLHVNFAAQTSAPYPGYVNDYGVAFSAASGSGWENAADATPASLVGNGRERGSALSPDKRYDTLVQMQQSASSSGGTLTPGRWEHALANGSYDVTVAVGDATATNSVDRITAEPGTANAVTIINNFQAVTGTLFQTVTKRVTISDGFLTLDPTGGSNTKIDFVDAVPAAADTIAPVVSVALAGALASGSTYNGPVKATVTATDNVAVTTLTYTLDGGASTPYTVPVVVSTVGSHTLIVSAGDAAQNTTISNTSFTIASTAPTSAHVNFATQTSAAVSGYTTDYGLAFDPIVGSGWENATTGAPASLVGNGRERNSGLSPDKRYDTLVQMQQTAASSGGTLTPGQWEYALANGDYNVTVAVGDATATNSVDRITAEPGGPNAVTIINNFQAVTGTLFQTVTKRVTISDGLLTLNATGGSNTKIDFVDVVPAGPLVDTTKPTASIALAGTVISGTTYIGTVTATVTAADEALGSGLKSVTYSLDGGADTPYGTPVAVTDVGPHTLSVTATDNASNAFTTTKSFTINPPETTQPTASVALAGNLAAGVYTGDVTATVTAADGNGGSGIKSITYTLDGGAVTPYTVPVVVHPGGNHTLNVTVIDNLGNTGTGGATWTSQPIDNISPTATVALAGTLYTPGVYGSDVTATVTAADDAGGSGVASVTYSLDGGADTPYTVPVVVSAVGPHTLQVTVTDNQSNVGTASKSWTQQAPDTTVPTASVALAGALAAGVYTGDVTATVSSADEAGGSGVKSVTYTLDGGAVTPYTVPVVVHSAGSHTLNVTVTDNALNVGTASATWTSQLNDTTPPTASVALAGTLFSPGVYTGNVTATVTAADNPGGSGLASVTYSLDGGAVTPYTVPVVVGTVGPHTLSVTATDNASLVFTTSKSWTQQGPDTTPPTASVALSGSLAGGIYTGDVTATVTAADEVGGSGLKSVTYSLDGGAPTPYATPITVTASGSHSITVTAKDNANNVGTASTAWNQQSAGNPHLTVTSPDNAILGLTAPRLVFSAVRGSAAPPARSFTFTNDGLSQLTISSLAIAGANANNWHLATGQATSVVIPAGGTAQVSIQFSPTDPTGCADTANPYAIGDADRNATLTFSTNDPTQPTGSSLLSGVNSCFAGGNNEPVLDQLLPALGYTDVVDTQFIDRRYIGPSRWLQNTDEIQSPYFKVADSSQPVSLVPIGHYGSPNTVPYQSTGWFAAGSTMATNSNCSNACKLLWQFPPDSTVNGVTTYNQNQKLLPSINTGGKTTFTPTGAFGIYSSDFSEVNFTDDSFNTAHSTANVDMPVRHDLHQMRVYPAYGPGHVAIPNTYIIGDDLSRVPSYKNNDYQDVILLLRNVTPAVAQGPVIGAATSTDLTTGGTVGAGCVVSGFDGVLPNTGGTQCNAANIAFSPSGLSLTSTAGQLANSNQQNALYKTFDATRNGFTVTARLLGPVTQLTNDFQQIGAWFGPDQANFVKVEAEHNGTNSPKLTMFYSEKGVSGTVASVSLPAMTTASTLDLIIKGNANVPDPLPFGDTYGVHNFPLDELTVYYSLDGAAPVQVGTTYKSPADVTGWFNRQSKAGILVSNSGAVNPLTATFTKFAITAP